MGDADSAFDGVSAAPTVQVQSAYTPPQVIVNAGSFGAQSLDGDSGNYTIRMGQSGGGGEVIVATFTESGLLELCRLYSNVCDNNSAQFRNIRFNLRPGGVLVYADVPVAGVWQLAGIALRLDGYNQFEVVGVDVGGVLYDSPPGDIAGIIEEIEREGNDLLREFTIQAGGVSYRLFEIYADEDSLTAILR